MTNNQGLDHMWFGRKKPTHVENSKEWTQTVENCVTGEILKEAFQQLYELTLQKKPDQKAREHILSASEELKQAFLETARRNNIPVWYPDADNDEF